MTGMMTEEEWGGGKGERTRVLAGGRGRSDGP